MTVQPHSLLVRTLTSPLKPIFEKVSAAQTNLPDSDGAIDGHLREVGLTFHLLKNVPGLISKNIEKSLDEAFKPLGIAVMINSLRSAMVKGSTFA